LKTEKNILGGPIVLKSPLYFSMHMKEGPITIYHIIEQTFKYSLCMGEALQTSVARVSIH